MNLYDNKFVASKLIPIIENLFSDWKALGVLGQDPDYTEELGREIAMKRDLLRSYDKVINKVTALRKELSEDLEDTCEHKYVAEYRGNPKASYNHQKYDKRICEVCGLSENGPTASYNLYNDLTDAKLGRVPLRRVDEDEFRKLEKIVGELKT